MIRESFGELLSELEGVLARFRKLYPKGALPAKRRRFRFTKTRLESLAVPAPGGQPYTFYDTELPKLCLRVQPVSGRKTFFVLKRIHGRTERKTLGTVFPETTIEQARKWAHRVLSDAAEWKMKGFKGPSPLAARRRKAGR